MEISNSTSRAEHVNGDESAASATAIISDLKDRAQNLLEELEKFRQHLRRIRQEGSVEIAHFRGTVQSEFNMLQKLSIKANDESSESTPKNNYHIARSSNVPFLEAVWNTAKRSKKISALQKRLYFNSQTKSLSQAMHHVGLVPKAKGSTTRKDAAVTVDVVTDDGLAWTKVSLVNNTRLLFDLAKQGWQSDGSDDEDADVVFGADEDSSIPLVNNARDLCQASQAYRVKTKRPKVRLILPRVKPGEVDDIDDVLDQCREAGAEVLCGVDLEETMSLKNALSHMAPDPFSTFTDILNIDCTILLALVSEFSHTTVIKEPWFHKSLQRQVEIEGNEKLLITLLYPALGDRRLVCTREAAIRMREIVDTIGTPSEKARTAIMMGDDKSRSQQDLVEEMRRWSAYDVPACWQLPIQIIDQHEDDCQSRLPSPSMKVSENMTAINRSVFLCGWARGYTTITSNRTVVKQLENDLETFEDLDDSVWPQIWLCPTARSLVGKEKRGAKRNEEKKGVWPLPDPLRREQQRRHGLDVLSSREGHEVEDLRPDGYPCEEVLEAKNAAWKLVEKENAETNGFSE